MKRESEVSMYFSGDYSGKYDSTALDTLKKSVSELAQSHLRAVRDNPQNLAEAKKDFADGIKPLLEEHGKALIWQYLAAMQAGDDSKLQQMLLLYYQREHGTYRRDLTIQEAMDYTGLLDRGAITLPLSHAIAAVFKDITEESKAAKMPPHFDKQSFKNRQACADILVDLFHHTHIIKQHRNEANGNGTSPSNAWSDEVFDSFKIIIQSILINALQMIHEVMLMLPNTNSANYLTLEELEFVHEALIRINKNIDEVHGLTTKLINEDADLTASYNSAKSFISDALTQIIYVLVSNEIRDLSAHPSNIKKLVEMLSSSNTQSELKTRLEKIEIEIQKKPIHEQSKHSLLTTPRNYGDTSNLMKNIKINKAILASLCYQKIGEETKTIPNKRVLFESLKKNLLVSAKMINDDIPAIINLLLDKMKAPQKPKKDYKISNPAMRKALEKVMQEVEETQKTIYQALIDWVTKETLNALDDSRSLFFHAKPKCQLSWSQAYVILTVMNEILKDNDVSTMYVLPEALKAKNQDIETRLNMLRGYLGYNPEHGEMFKTVDAYFNPLEALPAVTGSMIELKEQRL